MFKNICVFNISWKVMQWRLRQKNEEWYLISYKSDIWSIIKGYTISELKIFSFTKCLSEKTSILNFLGHYINFLCPNACKNKMIFFIIFVRLYRPQCRCFFSKYHCSRFVYHEAVRLCEVRRFAACNSQKQHSDPIRCPAPGGSMAHSIFSLLPGFPLKFVWLCLVTRGWIIASVHDTHGSHQQSGEWTQSAITKSHRSFFLSVRMNHRNSLSLF